MIEPYVPASRVISRSHASYDSELPDVFFYDDFEGNQFIDAWSFVENGGGSVTLPGDVSGGTARLVCSAASVGQARMDFGNVDQFDLHRKVVIEFRARFGVLPTSTILVTVGMQSPSSGTGTLFRFTSSALVRVITDTGTAVTVLTDKTLVVDTYYTFKIDIRKVDDVKFSIDGMDLLPDQKLDMTGLSLAGRVMEPFFQVQKTSGAVDCRFDIDYVKVWQRRAGTSL